MPKIGGVLSVVLSGNFVLIHWWEKMLLQFLFLHKEAPSCLLMKMEMHYDKQLSGMTAAANWKKKLFVKKSAKQH